MRGWSVVRWTGALGLAAVAVQLVGAVFGSVAGSAPGLDDPTKILAFAKNSHFALTTVLVLFLIGFSLFIGFIAGLPSQRRPNMSGSPRQRSGLALPSP